MEIIIPIVAALFFLMNFVAGANKKSDRLKRAEEVLARDRRTTQFYADANAKALLEKIIATLVVGVVALLWWMFQK
jgi:hypothetical protein